MGMLWFLHPPAAELHLPDGPLLSHHTKKIQTESGKNSPEAQVDSSLFVVSEQMFEEMSAV